MLVTELGKGNKQTGVAARNKLNMTDTRRQKMMCHLAGDTSSLEHLRPLANWSVQTFLITLSRPNNQENVIN